MAIKIIIIVLALLLITLLAGRLALNMQFHKQVKSLFLTLRDKSNKIYRVEQLSCYPRRFNVISGMF